MPYHLTPEFVQRMPFMNPQSAPSPIRSFDERGRTIEQTHRMMSFEHGGKYLAAPTIVNINGQLTKLLPRDAMKYAIENGEYLEFPSLEASQRFAEGSWKRGDMQGGQTPSEALIKLAILGLLGRKQ